MNRAESLYEKVKIAQGKFWECGGLTPLSAGRVWSYASHRSHATYVSHGTHTTI